MKGQYIQFFTKSKNTKNFHLLVEDCSNTIQLDGRYSLGKCCNLAVDLCRKNKMAGFRIMVERQIKHKDGDFKSRHYLTDCWKVFTNNIEI